ncbi:LPPG:FO 2-phospho-L-lactate transferase [Halopseudomonas litoralis]|uniref:LPPG:FO 2-phospho-L-lactate transferase n=1 Tax=Halopseudomonas litoralis TaxID=797277 RepID=A0A1H1Y1M0_9GAMM|nr:2-phospho-L-lactate transferase [Halopseudomonas litoralis]SDT15069.1 LPPG:FO 2-phospho-L-lactate transferase [Halopseudomonas litoralis]
MNSRRPRITLLAGGVGGAKLAVGLASICEPGQLSIIGNVADDQAFHGLWVSPDIDTLTYTLAGRIDSSKGWGLADESNRVLDGLKRLGCDSWMYLGDQDMATHIMRTHLRQQGVRPSLIAQRIAESFGVQSNIVLPTDDRVQTRIRTPQGWLSFQEYFVREQCQPEILEIQLDGLERATVTAEALAAIREADLLVIAPSNPIVSIGPILAIPGLGQAFALSNAIKIAVSPLIGGATVKGPADRMLSACGYSCNNLGIADCYADLIDGLIIDQQDQAEADALKARGIDVMVTHTLMRDTADKARLAGELLQFAQGQLTEEKQAC